MTTRAQLENTIRSLNSCDHLAPDEATRLRSAIKELEAMTGARVTVSGECISLDITKRNQSRSTYCPKCRTSGAPGTRCQCPSKRSADAGVPYYELRPGQAPRSRPAPAKPVHVQAPFNIGSTRLRAFESGALSAEGVARMSRGPKRDLAQALVESRDDLPTSFVDRQIELLR